MESENNNINENSISKDKYKALSIHKQFLDDSETYDNSTKYKNDNSEKNNSISDVSNTKFKKSIGFFPKKIFIEKPELDEKKVNNRKYSMEEHLIIKDFVPQLKPIEIHLVPSKLYLNKKGFKDNKLNLNNSFISCPNSEEESDICLSPINNLPLNKKGNIKKTRKILKRLKSGNIQKVMSKNVIESNCNIFKEYLKFEFDSEKDSFVLDDNLLLYDDNDFINYNMTNFEEEYNNENENKNNNDEFRNSVKNDRINSCSILDVLKNRISFDETI